MRSVARLHPGTTPLLGETGGARGCSSTRLQVPPMAPTQTRRVTEHANGATTKSSAQRFVADGVKDDTKAPQQATATADAAHEAATRTRGCATRALRLWRGSTQRNRGQPAPVVTAVAAGVKTGQRVRGGLAADGLASPLSDVRIRRRLWPSRYSIELLRDDLADEWVMIFARTMFLRNAEVGAHRLRYQCDYNK